ncbi:MAG: PAS domain-containing protein [Halorubrum sp.]
MHSGSSGERAGPSLEELSASIESDRILLFMRPSRDRELLVDTLGEQYRIETTTDERSLASTFDCCLLGAREFERVVERIDSRRERSAPEFLPFVLLAGDGVSDAVVETAWNHVDDVIELPVRKAALHSRIANLIERRNASRRLTEREQQLSETVAELQLKEQAMDEAPVGITLAESGDDDNPLVYINDEFQTLTGYGTEAVGEDCRFLQGPGTDPEVNAEIREALDEERRVSVDILNYRKNGQQFWNRLTIAPLRDAGGTVTHYVGFQFDITDRKLRERRLAVMNRVLSHNLRNRMNVIEGYADLLRSETDDPEHQRHLDAITEATAELLDIARTVQQIDQHMSTMESDETRTALRDRIDEIVCRVREEYPDATVTSSLPESDPLHVNVVGLPTAIEEGLENAVQHNDQPHPCVDIRADRASPEWIEIEIADDGPGIPAHETRVLEQGETSLDHGDRLGIWLMHWTVNRAGGEFSVATSDAGGTLLRFSVPADSPVDAE